MCDCKGLHPAVAGMVLGLPANGEYWTEAKETAWLEAFAAVLRFFHRAVVDIPADDVPK